jgi:hypothetical protein
MKSVKRAAQLVIVLLLIFPTTDCAQQNQSPSPSPYPRLEKMPVELERDYALSALPPHLRNGATVYLLDPEKGYYVSHPGTNGYICFVLRTSWEWGEFQDDLCVAISFDAEGARTIFPVHLAVAEMRASGKYGPEQIRDSIKSGVIAGVYKAPAKPGLSYMLSPVVRLYPGSTDQRQPVTVSVPHYMIYASYMKLDNCSYKAGTDGMRMSTPDSDIMGDGKGPYNYIILPATDKEKAIILEDSKDLLARLVAYKPYFALSPGSGTVHHH